MRKKAAAAIAIAGGAIGGSMVAARRRGTPLGTHTIVRCQKGHLFTTIWIPGVSLKAVRLGRRRFQYCPVGRHWTVISPVRPDDLSEAEREEAAAHRDRRIP